VDCSVSQTHDRTLIICFVDVDWHPCAEVQLGPDFEWFAVLSSGTDAAPVIEVFENRRSAKLQAHGWHRPVKHDHVGRSNGIDATIEISLFEVCKGSGCNGIGSPAGKEQRVDKVRSNGQEARPTAKEPQLEARFADTMGIGEIAGLSVGGRWHPKTADRIGSSKHRHGVPACS